ncbi:MAG: hypothetical protein IJ109_10410 [Firmicutes bacterium]|nr:hypothetical protein [Bacillota bacterium]MBQ9016508.1 hypothetical protein [Bacillota bacterium]
MAKVRFPFDISKINSAEEFRRTAQQAGYAVPVSGDLTPLGRSFAVGGRRFDNSMAIQPLEGLDACDDGSPSSLTLARYEKLAAQGAGILWVEATAVCPEGRDSGRQLWIHEGSCEGFRQLIRTIDASAAKAGFAAPYKVLQLTHSGRCSKDSAGNPAPMAAFASPCLDPVMGTPRIVTDEYLDQLQVRVGEAAALAMEAGFDAVELKLCHQYLFKELLCAYTRQGRYGGSRENRFRFALGAVDQIRSRVGSRIDVVVRLNAYDGIPWPYGWGMAAGAGAAVNGSHGGGAAAAVNGSAAAVTSSWQGNPQIEPALQAQRSNWQGNPDRQQILSTKTNWTGNPAPLAVSESEKSSWQGNPGRDQIISTRTNWQGNPAPFAVSDPERSSWQGNPGLGQIAGSTETNWQGNPVFAGSGTAAPRTCEGTGTLPPTCEGTGSAAGAAACDECSAPVCGPMRIDLTEVKDLMRQLYRKGIRIFNLTTTSPRFAPAGNGYLDNFNETAEVDPLAGTAALLQATREIRQSMPADIRIVGTGLSWFGPFSANVAAGGIRDGWFDIAGFGRSVMADDSFMPAILQGVQPDPARACIGCDSCFKLFFEELPTGCAMQHAAYRELLQKVQSGGNIIY